MFAAMPLSFLGLNDNSLYTMLMPQPRLVRLLEQRASALGVDLRWGDELTGFRCDSQSVVAEVSSPQRSYEISSRYLIGADGGRSLVRKTLGIEFPGCTSATVGRLAHVQLPDEFRTADRAVEIPEFGRLPFGHSRFDRGGVIFAEFEPGRSMLGTIEFGPPSRSGRCRWPNCAKACSGCPASTSP
ncbi:FAD binding domain protein [Mycobacterium ulcerans str. Harvey]|uniref:FAD binding domain protein n=1 Tax=Mycobacterium ulcerans str. Harvey TaxID=1299332 RepID=A0ABN0QWZ2_MYCUL|nr:FAD binding domain protein [Mycobacterium ulcerans str. Harvey]